MCELRELCEFEALAENKSEKKFPKRVSITKLHSFLNFIKDLQLKRYLNIIAILDIFFFITQNK